MSEQTSSTNELILQAHYLASDVSNIYDNLWQLNINEAVNKMLAMTKDIADIVGNISPTAKTLSNSIDLTNAQEEIIKKANEVNHAQGFERFPAALSLAETLFGDSAIALELVAGTLLISGNFKASAEVAAIGANAFKIRKKLVYSTGCR